MFLLVTCSIRALSSTPSSNIFRGHWFTRLALSYELDTCGMVPMPIKEIGTTALGEMRVLPTLRDVMQCLVVAHEERRWIMVSISGVMWHLGMDHPPFPKVGPSFQPPTQA
uniref:Uncharacterized protein n=1 Tax=Lactuca sativa TaxID=4236 RepID=A0A9R1XLG7_LACSA|nr:hypothetical protein LSAT_V11C300133210 [Lactuca sativa]